jgi:hypothetical protein
MDIEFSDSLPAIHTQHPINLNQIEASAPQLIAGKAYYQKVSLVNMISCNNASKQEFARYSRLRSVICVDLFKDGRILIDFKMA